ncbi:MAG TPA: hypothetical protein VFR15_09250 [Chloroflexia bacterium]|nr:hypothetical protein [Chloroflexia bacterium]
MSDHRADYGGSESQTEDAMDRYLTNKASALRYPPTPDIASSVRQRLVSHSAYGTRDIQHRPRAAWAAMALTVIVLLGALLAVPAVRGFVGDVYSGIVQAVTGEQEPAPVPAVTPPVDQSPPYVSLSSLRLYGETDLGTAQTKVTFPIKIPTYPADLGYPNRVYYQKHNGDVVVLVWTDPKNADRARLALHLMKYGNVAEIKHEDDYVLVNGIKMYWVTAPQSVEVLGSGDRYMTADRHIIEGDALMWVGTDGTTYRLETGLSRDETVLIARSISDLPVVPTPYPTSTPVSPASGFKLGGKTDLYRLTDRAGFEVRIPTAYDELVTPSLVYLQDLGGPAVVMAWYVPGRDDDLRMVLYQLSNGAWQDEQVRSLEKVVSETIVNGNPARWVEGPTAVYVDAGAGGETLDKRTFITDGHTLVWEENGITYRLEAAVTLEEAVRIAESLTP